MDFFQTLLMILRLDKGTKNKKGEGRGWIAISEIKKGSSMIAAFDIKCKSNIPSSNYSNSSQKYADGFCNNYYDIQLKI